MKYQEWLKRNPPETWMRVLKGTGRYFCDLCGDKPVEAHTYVPPEEKVPLDRKGLFAVYGLCKDCKRLPDWKQRIEAKLFKEITGKEELKDVCQVDSVQESSDAYFIVTIQGAPKQYFHPKEPQEGKLQEYDLKPDRAGAAVFKLENAKNLLRVLKMAAAENGDGDLSKVLAPEHVLAHTKEN